jgi:hypothetical protein
VTRAADLLMCLKSPQAYFGLPEQDDIHLLNVAASADQARRAFFAPMKRLFVTNPMLAEHFRKDPPGEMATSIQLKKGVELISGHSMAETQEGLNLLVGIADEISAFKTRDELARAGLAVEGRESKTAEGIVKMLRTSARTRFPDSFKVAQISYPRFKGDAIEQAMDIGRRNLTRYGEASQYYVSGPHATWDVNPNVSDRRKFQEDYDEDPEMAQAMYECRPPSAVNRFMRNDVRIATAFSRSIPDPITVEYFWGLPENQIENLLAPEEKPGWQVRFRFHPDLAPMDGARYALHGDLALRGDRAGVAMSHIRTFTETQPNPDGETIEPRPIIRNDFVFSFEADLAAHAPDGSLAVREVQIRWYRQLVWELISKGFYGGFGDLRRLPVRRHDPGLQEPGHRVQGPVAGPQRLRLPVLPRRRLRRTPGGLLPAPGQERGRGAAAPAEHEDRPPAERQSKDEADALAGSVVGAIEVGGDEGEEPIGQPLHFLFDEGGAGGSFEAPSSFGGSPKASMTGVGDLMTLSFG